MKMYMITIYVCDQGGHDTIVFNKLFTEKDVAEATVYKINELFETRWDEAKVVLTDDFGMSEPSSAEAELNELSTSDNEVDEFIEAILFEPEDEDLEDLE